MICRVLEVELSGIHSGVSAGQSIFSKIDKNAKIWPKMAKNGLFLAVFGIFETKICRIRPVSAIFSV